MGRYVFSGQQLEQLKQLKQLLHTLRKLNWEARRLLTQVGDSLLTMERYAAAGHSFQIVALRMRSVLELRERIVEKLTQEIDVVIKIVLICDDCVDPLDQPPAENLDGLNLDPEDLSLLDLLIDFAYRTEDRVCSRCTSQTLPKAFFTGINRLKRALLWQQQSFRKTAPRKPSSIKVVEDQSDICTTCNRPVDRKIRNREGAQNLSELS